MARDQCVAPVGHLGGAALVSASPSPDTIRFTSESSGGYGGAQPQLPLLRQEPLGVVPRRPDQGVVLRMARLDQHPAALGPPARAAGHLGEELEGSLGGAEIGQVEAGVGVHHADQRDVGEVEPLRDHLGADQEIHLAPLHRAEDPLVGPLGAGGVEVHARHPGAGIALRQQLLELLGPDAAHLLHRIGRRPGR